MYANVACLLPGRAKDLSAPCNQNQKCDGQRNGLIWLGKGQVVGCCGWGNEPPSSIKCGECSLFASWSG